MSFSVTVRFVLRGHRGCVSRDQRGTGNQIRRRSQKSRHDRTEGTSKRRRNAGEPLQRLPAQVRPDPRRIHEGFCKEKRLI